VAETVTAATETAAAVVETATDDAHARPLLDANASSALGAGKRLAHFQLERPLGRGGMGEVWLARDLALDRPVAIKVLSRDIGDAPSLRERFYREARAQARVLHANVGHLYFIGEDDGQIFFAMEYIEGESLQQRLRGQQKLPPAEALEYCRQAALGLREAQRHGFTHRDVKPSNLMIDRHGRIALLDFGIVKHHVELDDGGRQAVELTLKSSVIGTPLYMAPEQAKGGTIDFRADIYALGATLHHMLTGKPPFGGTTALELVTQHLTEPKPPLALGRRGESALESLVDRLLAKRPEDRFASYDDLIEAFEQASPETRRPAGAWVRIFASALDLVAVLAVLSLADLAVGDRLPPPLRDAAIWLGWMIYEIAIVASVGRTLGKMALEIEIVPEARGGRVTAWQAVVRFVTKLGPIFVGLGIVQALQEWRNPVIGPLALAIGAVGIVLTVMPLAGLLLALMRADRRTWWDRASGTRVRYSRSRDNRRRRDARHESRQPEIDVAAPTQTPS
jgi:hypothetical protein